MHHHVLLQLRQVSIKPTQEVRLCLAALAWAMAESRGATQ